MDGALATSVTEPLPGATSYAVAIFYALFSLVPVQVLGNSASCAVVRLCTSASTCVSTSGFIQVLVLGRVLILLLPPVQVVKLCSVTLVHQYYIHSASAG